MKKFICLLSALVLLVSLSVSTLAADFVPSISYKDGPGISIGWLDGDDVTSCLVITSIKQALDKTTDITQEERDLLLKVYEELKNGDFTNEYVIRDLIDLNFKYNDCRQVHSVEDGQSQSGSSSAGMVMTEATTQEAQDMETKLDELNDTDKNLKVKFNLGVSAGTDVIVKTYTDGKWSDIKSVVNNGDGTVTCEFEHLCPVLFAVKESQSGTTPPQTGDTSGKYLPLWIGTMALSGVALVTLVVVAFKKKEQ